MSEQYMERGPADILHAFPTEQRLTEHQESSGDSGRPAARPEQEGGRRIRSEPLAS
jgi:hypothetical protein